MINIKYLEDILIASGAAVIVGATFMVSTIYGTYSLGIALIAAGIFYAKFAGRGSK